MYHGFTNFDFLFKRQFSGMAVWLSGNALVWINEVTLHWIWLVLGWVTIYRRVNHLGQLSLAIPLWVGSMSINESWGENRHTTRCISPVSMVLQHKLWYRSTSWCLDEG